MHNGKFYLLLRLQLPANLNSYADGGPWLNSAVNWRCIVLFCY